MVGRSNLQVFGVTAPGVTEVIGGEEGGIDRYPAVGHIGCHYNSDAERADPSILMEDVNGNIPADIYANMFKYVNNFSLSAGSPAVTDVVDVTGDYTVINNTIDSSLLGRTVATEGIVTWR